MIGEVVARPLIGKDDALVMYEEESPYDITSGYRGMMASVILDSRTSDLLKGVCDRKDIVVLGLEYTRAIGMKMSPYVE